MQRLGRSFFERYTPTVAKELLGCTLVRNLQNVRMTGKIVEVEAYRGEGDPASHAYRGLTQRNSVMFGRGGLAYVYFSYGYHHCLNLTTEREGRAGAVLVRALKPLEGIEEMKSRRGVDDLHELASGPGKLTKALGIDLSMNGTDVVASDQLFVAAAEVPVRLASSVRVGISRGRERRWRFFIRGNPFVSRVKATSLV